MKDELKIDSAISAYHSFFAAGVGRLYEQLREPLELDAVIRRNLEILGYGE